MLILTNLSKNFHGKFVLKNINYNFPQSGLIALVGVNGAGKTTLLNILCNLDEPDNEVFTLKVLGELNYKEIAQIFGKQETWARVTYHRARVKIQDILERRST